MTFGRVRLQGDIDNGSHGAPTLRVINGNPAWRCEVQNVGVGFIRTRSQEYTRTVPCVTGQEVIWRFNSHREYVRWGTNPPVQESVNTAKDSAMDTAPSKP